MLFWGYSIFGRISHCNPYCKFNLKFRPWRSWAIMLKFFVADQCTKRHNKNSQPGCLDVFDKNLHALLYNRPEWRCSVASKRGGGTPWRGHGQAWSGGREGDRAKETVAGANKIGEKRKGAKLDEGDGHQRFSWDSDFEMRSLTSIFFQNYHSLGKWPIFYHI